MSGIHTSMTGVVQSNSMPMIVRELDDECEVNFEEHFEANEAKGTDRDKPKQNE